MEAAGAPREITASAARGRGGHHAPNLDEAVAWGRKAVAARRAPVEVREFLAMPAE